MDNTQRLNEATALEAMLSAYSRKAPGTRFRKAPWLLSDYGSEVWTIHSDKTFQLDWRVKLHDGSLLTAHPALWESLRSWLIASTHIDVIGRELLAPTVQHAKLVRVIHCIDYVLLNSKGIGLLTSGLRGMSENDLKCMVGLIASNRSIKDSVYGWPRRLASFLRIKIASLPVNAIEDALSLHPDLLDEPPDEDDRLTDLSTDEIMLARAWIARGKMYRMPSTTGYRFAPRVSLFIDDIYPDALRPRFIHWTVPVELCLGSDHSFFTEHFRARVHSPRDERRSDKSLNCYVASITALAALSSDGIDAPRFNIDEIHRFANSLSTKKVGRFRTLPQDVVFESLRQAIEYALKFGDDLVDSYLALAEAAHRANCNIGPFSHGRDIRPYLTNRIEELGICRWSIEPINAGLPSAPPPLNKQDWFAALRSNHGLCEALQVLYGAIQVVVGLLMARRAGELHDLVAGQCLDKSETRLVFKNRKSGIGGMRQTEARPIPPIGVRFIKLLDRLQTRLLKIGAIPEKTTLFAFPTAVGSKALRGQKSSFVRCIDLFCDWAETPLDAEGKRYYLRQHQLRRFFAMLFFWGGGFGGMDTLRWFLGHTDVQHLWHYITESTPGMTIRSVAAEWGVHQVKEATEEGKCLADELAVHFGTRDFSVLEEEALVLHLEDLMEEGRLTIEPQFLDGGKQYRIAVLLKRKDSP